MNPTFIPPSTAATSATVAMSSLSLQDVPRIQPKGPNDIPYFYFNAIGGLPTFVKMVIAVNAFGLEKHFWWSDFPMLYERMTPIDGRTVRRQRGSELRPLMATVSCQTADGSGLQRVRLRVAAPTGGGIQILNRGSELEGQSGRKYEVAEEPTLVDGYQEIEIAPKNGPEDLQVVGGQCLEFPNGQRFGYGATLKLPSRCNQTFNDFYSGPDEYEACRLSTSIMRMTRDSFTLQNQLAAGQIATARFYGGPDDNPIGIFLTTAELASLTRAATESMYHMWFGAANTNPALGSLSGDGIYHSIAPEYRFNIAPSEYGTIEGLRRICDFLYEVNPSASDQMTLHQGYFAFQQTQQTLSRENLIQYREDPYRDKADVTRPYASGDRIFKNFTNFAGYTLNFAMCPAFSNLSTTSRNAPNSSNQGHRAWQTIALDHGPLQNVDPATGQFMAESGLGSNKVNVYCAKNVLSGEPDFITDITLRGATLPTGEKQLTGEVISFDDRTSRQVEFTTGVEVTPGAGLSFEI